MKTKKMNFKDPSNFVNVEPELSPGSIEQWLSVVKDEKKLEKGTRRSDISSKVKKHLSALGWVFSYAQKGKRLELRYKSPNGKWFYSLATACMSCFDEDEVTHLQKLQIVPKPELSCSTRNLDASNQTKKERNRLDDCVVHVSSLKIECSSTDLIEIVPKVDELNQQCKRMRLMKCSDGSAKRLMNEENPSSDSNQQQNKNKKKKTKMKKSKLVKDSDMAVFNEDNPIEVSLFNVDVSYACSSISSLSEYKGKLRSRKGKSLKKSLQVMEKKNEKEEKESKRFWRKDCGPDMSSDVCCACHWGGDLLLCDGCPSAFHYTCLGLTSLPEEELWFCPRCCCDICKSMESSGNSKLMTCEQCHKRFHLKCLQEEEEEGASTVSCRGWFCSSQCNKVFSTLESLLGCKITVGEDNLIWTLMRSPNEGEHYNDEQKAKLASVVELLHEGFEPTKDPLSGKDLVEELVLKREGTGIGRGFYTVVIERNNEIITVATVRVRKDVAEIPLVVTASSYRRSGMCRVLMDELEKKMFEMGVCRLVLPAAKEVLPTWTGGFGFSVMESLDRLEVVKHGMLDFAGTVMCHKFLVREEVSGKSILTD